MPLQTKTAIVNTGTTTTKNSPNTQHLFTNNENLFLINPTTRIQAHQMRHKPGFKTYTNCRVSTLVTTLEMVLQHFTIQKNIEERRVIALLKRGTQIGLSNNSSLHHTKLQHGAPSPISMVSWAIYATVEDIEREAAATMPR